MVYFLAWVIIVLKALELLIMPLLFGTKKKAETWTYSTWLVALIEGLIVVPVALRVLGYI